jgi:hypothetical protein
MKFFKIAALSTALVGVALAGHAGASPWGLITDPALLARSANLPVYTEAQANQQPQDPKVLGVVSASVCDFQADSAANQAEALSQLRARAALQGANGVTSARYLINSNTRSSCWHRGYTVTGVAVVFN